MPNKIDRMASWALITVAMFAADPAGGKIDYRRDVQPILAEYCLACHGPDSGKRQAGLRLDVREQATKPLDSGAIAIVPGDATKSELVRRIGAMDDERMPPAETNKRLSDEQKRVLERWIAEGASYAGHWAFEPIARPALPAVSDKLWPRNQIDQFTLARLDAAGISPSREAKPATLLRRVTLDLTGLPPTLDEIDAFLADRSPDAFEKVVDRLLASPHYGEHLARDWLDAARYADTHGYFTDHERFMWRWRDWVIDAFNRNMPFDQFTIEQLAGDLLPEPTISQRIATGFNRNHMVTEETGVIPEEYRVEYVADRVRTTTAVWMGLTAGCAQCHDHKYDPLTQREYFQLFAYFNNVPETGISGGKKNAPPLLDLATSEEAARRAKLRKQIAALDAKLKPPATGGDEPAADVEAPTAEQDAARKQLEAERDALKVEEQRLLARTTVMVMQEQDKPRETHVLIRGKYDQSGEKVGPGVPAFLPPVPEGAPANRLGFAQWLVDPRHPLTSRVAVNRHWRQAFGEGLVRTVEDFGVRGEAPSHPALLDWLASDFVESGWDVKRLERRLVTSATYRQTSAILDFGFSILDSSDAVHDSNPKSKIQNPKLVDPSNRLLWHYPRRRLDAEEIRDSALAAAGLLVPRIGGPSVRPYQPADLWKHITYDRKNTQSYEQSIGEGLYRRSVYTYWKRQIPPPTMQLLDAPTRETCVLRRQRTTTSLQALALLNDVQFVEAARGLATRMIQAADSDPDRIRLGFRLLTARAPSDAEIAEIRTLLEAQRNEFRVSPSRAKQVLAIGDSPLPPNIDASELAAWTVVGNLLLNLDEALCRE
jgi:hypothetical protein